ncbi:hypothetical protein D3C85_1033160 [compost metagenome]
MKPAERYVWIECYLKELSKYSQTSVDILDADFVGEYISATGAKWSPGLIGAPFCSQLPRDLLAMHRDGILKRHRSGLWSMAGMGFPRWVWVYRLSDAQGEKS